MKTMKSFVLLIWLGISIPAVAQQSHKLSVSITDDNGLPVAQARVTLTGLQSRSGSPEIFRLDTDYAGRSEFANLNPGNYSVRVEKDGFYAATLDNLELGRTETVEIKLLHEQELRDAIDVTYSPPTIDPSKTSAGDSLTLREIVNIPYPTTRDYRNAIRYIPGVVQDSSGQLHINGSASYQIYSELDGFNISQPSTGTLQLRVNPDALRAIEVKSSRYSSEYGKGSGGVLSLATGMGDDRFRFSATDFFPSFQTRKGVHINGWTPRATFSGPLRKKRAWFFDAIDGDYNLDIIDDLPSGADRSDAWRVNNLAKTQFNISQTNVLSASLLVNYFYANNFGLSRFNPVETTRELKQISYLTSIKDQNYFSNGVMLEVGFAASQFQSLEQPLGIKPYYVLPEGTIGNYFKTADGRSQRFQWISNLYLPPVKWNGRHDFKIGIDLDLIRYRQFAERRSIHVLRENGRPAREVNYSQEPRYRKNNFESGVFAQDRWSVTNRWLIEGGLRLDWDKIIGSPLLSPRVATTYLLTRDGETKLSGGVGLFYDPTNLGFITRPQSGRRFDTFFDKKGGSTTGQQVESCFQVNVENLKAPSFINTSLGIEHKLPGSIYARFELIWKRGSDGFTFINRNPNQPGSTKETFELENIRRDHYTGYGITLRKTFREDYTVFLSYTRSSARSNAIFEYNIDNILFSPQADGPLPWDTPNRLIAWGWLPLIKKFDLGYSLEWRDGYPFSLINEDQQLVSAANSERLPAFFSLNLHAERRFRLMGINWALRAGFNNVTDRRNASEVNNNIDSSKFLSYGGVQGRAFVGRIRFLGRK